ncbi:MAG: methyltransferase domain-containing protein [Phycisphaerales bacterium]|nr:methyltransferase domain-containing protein [Phycisphaerales bacterium]
MNSGSYPVSGGELRARKWLHRGTLCAWILLPALVGLGCRSTGVAETPREASVKPGINEAYKTEPVDVWIERFETESREIYSQRERIVEWIGLKPEQSMADIGAGTGLFEPLFARGVGANGTVYAVDLTPAFVERIDRLAKEQGLKQVRAVQCKEDSVELPPGCIDAAFICDTYHHFEYPRSTMASLHRALRPGGQVVIVDFIRVPGVSRDWVLDHVRIGKEDLIREVESFGFKLVQQAEPDFLKENYVLRFARRD